MTDITAKLLIATTNEWKLQELTDLLSSCPFTLVTPKELGIVLNVSETGSTLEENAIIKASSYARICGMLTLADDSGLEVEALGGAPGVRSARYAGRCATDDERIRYLLNKLDNVPETNRLARFRCVIAIAQPHQPPKLYAGECHGKIVAMPKGENGFGYDPVFLIPEIGKTMAELSPAEKNLFSHRFQAVRRATEDLQQTAAALGTVTT